MNEIAQLPQVDLRRLFKLRLVVARHGEMDVARWWNTQGVLGARGEVVFKRGFPSTHYFAQARVAFSVARSRCQEVFDPPECITLWHLPAELEDQFEDHWQEWLDEGDEWRPFFEGLKAHAAANLLDALEQRELLSEEQREQVSKLRRSAESRAVAIPGTHSPNDDVTTLLAAAFDRGETGSPAIPYARLEG